MDLYASVIFCEIGLGLWVMQKHCKTEQTARSQESDASDGRNHGRVEKLSHITALTGPWQGLTGSRVRKDIEFCQCRKTF